MSISIVAGQTLTAPRQRSLFRDAMSRFTRNKAALVSSVFIILLLLVALLADNSVFVALPRLFGADLEVKPLLAPRPYDQVSFKDNNTDPNAEYPLGADYLGRDILSRTIFGTRVSLSVALVASLVSLFIGMAYGLISGYAGGRVDEIMMRIVDYLYGFPVLILIILMQVYFQAVTNRQAGGVAGFLVGINRSMGGLFFMFIAIGMLNWLQMARIARGQVLSLKTTDFVTAARAVGAGTRRITSRHLLPNILGPCVIAETVAIPTYIFLEAFLSFLGLGVSPPTPSWGIMISDTYQGLTAHPALLLGPSVALSLTTLAFNFLGDGLRDALDPRFRGRY